MPAGIRIPMEGVTARPSISSRLLRILACQVMLAAWTTAQGMVWANWACVYGCVSFNAFWNLSGEVTPVLFIFSPEHVVIGENMIFF